MTGMMLTLSWSCFMNSMSSGFKPWPANIFRIQCNQLRSILQGIVYWKCRFPLTWSVRLLAGWSVCHNFLKGREVSLPCPISEHLFINAKEKMVFLVLVQRHTMHVRTNWVLSWGNNSVTTWKMQEFEVHIPLRRPSWWVLQALVSKGRT